MKLLIDTHIWIWMEGGSRKLGPRTRREIESARNQVWISPASIVELVSLCRKGRVKLNEPLSSWLPRALEGTREATITHDVAAATENFRGALPDPVDSILAASAAVYGLRLVTADERLLRVPGIEVVGNRR